MEPTLFLRNLWYFALHGTRLKSDKLIQREILGEKIVFGRDRAGKPFALRDNCPHRGIPLSEGSFDGETIQCCYHGWKFNCAGACQKIPAMQDAMANLEKIRAFAYPCEEKNGTIWVYIPEDKTQLEGAKGTMPDLLIPEDKMFLHVERFELDGDIDHANIGLIDPAHVTFVHQSWFWRTSSGAKLKEKHFQPVGKGFRMARHKPKGSAKGYSILRGGISTEITFEIPGHRFEHIQVGETDSIVSITVLTPINETTTELNHIFYSTLGWLKFVWWPLVRLGRAFICQDVRVFRKLAKGLASNPKLMLVGDPDAQARWYFELKKQRKLAQDTQSEFVNTIQPATLHWIT